MTTAETIATWTDADLMEEYEGAVALAEELEEADEPMGESCELLFSLLWKEKRKRGL